MLLTAAAAATAFGSITLEPADTSTVRVEAPQLLTRAVAVVNLSAGPLELRENVALPSGWRNVTADSLFSVAPQSRDLRLLCLSIPADAAPGLYSLPYRVAARSGDQISVETVLPVEVLPVLKINLVQTESPRRVLAGEEYTARFEMLSRANVPCSVSVHARASTGVPVRVSETAFELKPGERRELTAHIASNRTIRQAQSQWLIFRVEASGGALRAAQQSTTSAEIIPRAQRGEDRYHKVPSRASVRYAGADDQSGFQLEVGGAGTFDSQGKYRLDYLMRGPRNLERHLYGMRDEYCIGVEHNAGQLRVGDQSFSLSLLTERNRLGRGIAAMGKQGRFSFGGYTFAGRLNYPDLTETAAFVSVKPPIPAEFRMNLLDKAANGSHRRMASLTGTTRSVPRTAIETEVGAGEGLLNRANAAYAASARIGVDLPLRTRFSIEGVHADPDYPGYYRDQNFGTLALFVPLIKQVRWQTSYRYFAQNLERDTSLSTALRERQFLTGWSCSLPHRVQVNVDLEDIRRRDALPPGDYDHSEKTVGLRFRQPHRWFTAGATGRRGGWRAAGGTDYCPVGGYGTTMTLTPRFPQRHPASFPMGHTGASASRNRIWGLSASCRLIPGLLLTASWQKCDYPGYAYFENDQLAFDVRYTVFRHHVISLRYRQLDYERDYLSRGTSWMLGYELPLAVPVNRQNQFGCIKGRVRDAERADNSGISGAVIKVGNRTIVTDNKGQFVFPSLEPGVHYLQVEKASIGLDRVTTRRVPLEIRVRGGRTETVDLAVTHGATLSGHVAVFGLGSQTQRGIFVEQDSAAIGESADSMQYLYDLAGIDVELRSDFDARRVLTDRNGRFVFDELAPGRWMLTVSSHGLPTFHTIENDSRDLVVEPASYTDISIRVLPLKRSVIIVDEGKVPVVTKRK